MAMGLTTGAMGNAVAAVTRIRSGGMYGDRVTDAGGWGNVLSGPMLQQLRAQNAPSKIQADGTISNPEYAWKDPSEISSQVTRAQWQDYQERYVPRELEALGIATDMDFTEEGDRAGATAARQQSLAAGAFTRQLGRQNVQLTDAQKAGLSRRRMFGQSQAVAGAENVTRRGLKDRNVNALADMVAIGRGIQNTAAGGLQSAANMQAQRDEAGRQMKAQQRAQMFQTAGTLGALAIFAGIPI